MTRVNGVHHLAINTADIKSQIEFFSDVLGAELVGLFWMHGVEGAWHAFCRLDDHCSISFVELPANHEIESTIGITHAGNGAGPSAPGTTQHLAFNVDTLDELLTMRDRIRSRGVQVMGPIDHGMIQSIYFAGPEHLSLEIAVGRAIDAEQWVDPEVQQLCGITDEELAELKDPASFERPDEPVPQPQLDESAPSLHYPPPVLRAIMGMSDADMWTNVSFPDPPVPPGV